ncbi:hypothetical protein B7H20_08540 [Pseudomonas aeruginosa]|uniref:hypothetical protein n=1 Tax=Pseudomonas aeruginosa TaxID=287 RepID=UPI000A1176DF|nr:hypothetical protein [Pseudomonas aeruginosa]ORL59591.1 hypothetical protein B7H20_08540 [Pseudomonas aeruginosa]
MTSSSVGKGIAISGMFFMLGLCFGSLSSRMATIKDGLQLSDGVFGSALFAMSARGGALVAGIRLDDREARQQKRWSNGDSRERRSAVVGSLGF